MSLNKSRNPFYIQESIRDILEETAMNVPEFETIDFEESISEVDTSQDQFGTISLKLKVNDNGLRKQIQKNSRKFDLPKPLDVDTLWMTCSMYYNYDNGQLIQKVCNLRNGFQFPVSSLIDIEQYNNMENGVTFTVQNALQKSIGNVSMDGIKKQLTKIKNKKLSLLDIIGEIV